MATATADHNVDALQSEKAELEKQVDELQERHDDLQERERTVRSEIRAIHDDLESGEIDDVPDELGTLRTKADTLKDTRMSIGEKIDQAHQARSRISTIETQLQEQDTIERLRSIASECREHQETYESAMQNAETAVRDALREALDALEEWESTQRTFKAAAKRVAPGIAASGRGDDTTAAIRRALDSLRAVDVDVKAAVTAAPQRQQGKGGSVFDRRAYVEAGADPDARPVTGPVADVLFELLEQAADGKIRV